MDAELRHVAKYAEPYQKMFPDATLAVHLSTARSAFFMSQEERKDEALRTVALLRDAYQRARQHAPEAVPTAVYQSFSNGGLIPLATMLRYSKDAPAELPHTLATVMDCSPGCNDGSILADAATVGFKADTAVRKMELGVWKAQIRTGHAISSVIDRILGRDDPITFGRKTLNDPRSWVRPGVPDRIPPRLYAYTEIDPYIPPPQVLAHATEAYQVQTGSDKKPCVHELEGVPASGVHILPDGVQLCRWEKAQHCSLARHAPETYWEAIRQFMHLAVAQHATFRAKY